MNDLTVEDLIISNLIYNDSYIRATLPFVREEYFQRIEYREVFLAIKRYFEKYNNNPTREALQIELDGKALNENLYRSCIEILKRCQKVDSDHAWLIKQTEKYCQDKAIYNAIM